MFNTPILLNMARVFSKNAQFRRYANAAIKIKEVALNTDQNIPCESQPINDDFVARPVTPKNFTDIPGPNGIFGIGTFYQYFPVIGKYTFDEVHKSGFDKYQKYGDIVREHILPGVDIVWLFDPHDIAKVLNNTGPTMYPQRKSHLALEKYRKDRPHIYKTAGLLPTNGSEWWRLRSELQKGLSSPNHIRQFLHDSDSITKKFVSQIQQTATTNAEHIEDFLPELSRLNLELVCYLAFDVRMNSFSDVERNDTSRSSRLIQAAEDSNSCLIPLDQGLPIWKFVETPTYRKFSSAQKYLESVAIDLVNQKISCLNDDPKTAQNATDRRRSLLDDYLANPKLDMYDVVGMACDLLLAGVDTTTYSTCFLLYHLARNPHVQQNVFEEAIKILPHSDEDEITTDHMAKHLNYSRAVLKETFRMNPVSVGVGRTTNTDLILSGYNVPKGTIAVTQNYISCRLDKHFEAPLKFMPERWLRTVSEEQNKSKAPTNPYLVLPFGHGMRSCIARRFAEQNMLVLMLRLIRKYQIEWKGVESLGIKTTTTINKPDHSVKFAFKLR